MERRIIQVDERLPLLPTIPLSLQHLFAMFGSTVLVPFLLHVDPATALFMNGIGTLLYLTICKWRLPAYLGSSFAFISPVLAVCATPGMSYGDAQGGVIVFGLSFMVLAAIVDKVGTNAFIFSSFSLPSESKISFSRPYRPDSPNTASFMQHSLSLR